MKFFAVESGNVKLSLLEKYSLGGGVHLKSVSRSESFGVLEFFTDEPRYATAVSDGSTKLLSIKRR